MLRKINAPTNLIFKKIPVYNNQYKFCRSRFTINTLTRLISMWSKKWIAAHIAIGNYAFLSPYQMHLIQRHIIEQGKVVFDRISNKYLFKRKSVHFSTLQTNCFKNKINTKYSFEVISFPVLFVFFFSF